MPLIVQKFGGTSVASTQKILAAARKAIRAQQEGNQVVVVVSAMGHQTDHLVDLAAEITDRPSPREMDMLLSTGEQVSVALMAIAIHSLGHKAVSLTGAQIGIKTDSTYSKARIKSISTERMQKLLSDGNIVIAAGFQGIDDDFNITTLGRGGSDTTAVSLAAVLGADSCEIYTDVDGVYTTDPRVLPEARRVLRVSYNEMLELASLGAGVMHSRSIEFAKKFHVPVHVRSSATDIPGTLIVADAEAPGMPVGGAAITKNEARIAVLDVPDKPGSSYEIFSRIAAKNISIDMIVQNVGTDGKADIAFTVPIDELHSTLEAVNEAAKVVGASEVTHDQSVSKVSVVGLGMAQQTGVADRMFRALANVGINIQMITTSEIKISVLVERDQAQTALREVHREFNLDKIPAGAVSSIDQVHAENKRTADATAIIARLQGLNMEDLTIDDISLDSQQARITIQEVPDQPGVAALVFERIANAGIFVDMIVQSYAGPHSPVSIGFTVPQDSLEEALVVANKLATELKASGVTHSAKAGKLSVSGVGLRTNTGVAIRMFRALSEAGINVEMISTSEVRVNVVVDGAKGELGLKQLQAAFADVMR